MASKKKSAAVEKSQAKLVDHIDLVSQMTSGQLAKNHLAIIEQFTARSCELLAAIEAHFNPAPKTDPEPNAE